MQGADVQRRPSGAVDRVVARRRALSRRLLLGRHPGLLGLDALGTIEHHLDHGVLHQRGEAEQQAGDEPDVNGLDVGDLGQLGGQRGALGGQGEHREDSCERETRRPTSVKQKRLKLGFYARKLPCTSRCRGMENNPRKQCISSELQISEQIIKCLCCPKEVPWEQETTFRLLDEDIQ